MSVKQISSKAEFDAIIGSGKVVFVDFYTTWCGPCKAISPTFEDLAKQNHKKESAEFYKVDIDQLPEVADQFGVYSIPTFLVFKNGGLADTESHTVRGADRARLTALVESGLELA